MLRRLNYQKKTSTIINSMKDKIITTNFLYISKYYFNIQNICKIRINRANLL